MENDKVKEEIASLLPSSKELEKYGLFFKGLKCDNPSCGYKDMSIDFKDYPLWVNKPCPQCGQSLFTEADYLATLKIAKKSLTITDFFSRHKILAKLFFSFSRKRYIIDVEMNGSGKAKFHWKKSE